MFNQTIEKINFLLDGDLEIITLLLAFLLGSTFAISNALHPSIYVKPLSPINASVLAMLGSLFRLLVLSSIIFLLCNIISKTKWIQKLKTRFSSYFYIKFNTNPYGLYHKSHALVLVLFLSSMPFLNPIISCLVGYVLHLDIGRNLYTHIVGLIINNMLLTLFYLNNTTKILSIILFSFSILTILALASLPFLRMEKKIK